MQNRGRRFDVPLPWSETMTSTCVRPFAAAVSLAVAGFSAASFAEAAAFSSAFTSKEFE